MSITNSLKPYWITIEEGQIALLDSKPDSDKNYPTLLFIHGHCSNKDFFAQQMHSPLLKQYRLISLDLPGYGESPPPKNPEKTYCFPGFADVVVEVVKALKIENLIVVGWSMGGHVALELTTMLPQIKGILITGTPPIEISAEGLGRGFRIANPRILACFGKGNLTDEEAQLLATVSGYDYSPEKRYLVDAVLQTDEGAKTIYPASIIKGVGQNEVEIVSKWPRPIAVIAGKNDAGINNDYIMHEVKFRNLWRGKVHVIENGGHAVFMEEPQQFNTLLKEFCQSIFTPSTNN